jgi:NAD(P)-dependent dehydrogenase (short-subunit alcohol dehydrogenase family)
MQLKKGQVAVVTGGASGIGRSLAHALADRGLKLVVADIDEPALDEATADLLAAGADAIAVPTDVRHREAIEALRDAALDAYGHIDLACNNAGVAAGGRSWETAPVIWEWILDVDLWSVIHGVGVFVPVFLAQGHGHIVNTASLAGLTAVPFLAPYVVAKHGVVALSETLHHELKDTGVGVTVLCPSFTNTRIHELDRLAPDDVLAARPARAIDEGPGREAFRQLIESGLDPDDVVQQLITGIEADRVHVVCPPSVSLAVTDRMQWILDDIEG